MCVDGDTMILSKPARFLKRGDYIPGKVQLVVLYSIDDTMDMCEVEPGVWVTPWHPMYVNDRWVFPIHLVKPVPKYVTTLVNVVISSQTKTFGNQNFIALAHGCEKPYHGYWGTDRVLQDLRPLDGYIQGRVVIRKAKNLYICGVIIGQEFENPNSSLNS